MDETPDRVVCRTPTPNRKPTRIEKWKFDAVRHAILEVLPNQAPGVAFMSELPGLVEQALTAEERATLGSVGWYTTTVKLELEVRGEIARVPRSSPQRLIRVI
ncbi:MAG: DUF6958 family protein [Anaerolineae bacterium]